MAVRNVHELGAAGEMAARRYLSGIGYEILCQNYRKRCGEIDLIAKDGECLVFVEVKSRSDQNACPREAVTPKKQARLRLAAQHYLAQTGYAGFCRFDVVEVFFYGDGRPPLARHWRNVF